MATWSGGNGTHFSWLRKSCDISTCDLNPDGNPEKYGRPVKSAILFVKPLTTSERQSYHWMPLILHYITGTSRVGSGRRG